MTRSHRAGGFGRGFAVTLAMTGLFLAILPGPTAFAVTCVNQGWVVDSFSTDQQYGARAATNLVVNPAGTTCTVIRSVYIIRDLPNNYVEVGYFEDGPDQPDDPCSYVTTPHILVYAVVDGFVKCKTGTQGLTAGQEYSFRVDNPDHDFDFVYYWDDDTTPSISLGFYATDHRAGYPQMASERGTTSDSLRADFGGVNSLGGAGNWHVLSDPDVFSVGNVGSWDVCSWGGTSLIVKNPC
jgi:hypothetical protein